MAEQNENINTEPTVEQEPAAKKTADKTTKTKETKKKPAKASDLEAQLAAAESRAEKAEQELAESKATLLRTAAEYENYRKRTQKEQEASFGHGVGHAACELLPVLDTLEAAAKTETEDEDYKKGVLMILETATEVFAKLGIKEIEAEGKPFDPELHNAVMQQPAEGVESGVITMVMQKGYTCNDRVVRHSMVAVAP